MSLENFKTDVSNPAEDNNWEKIKIQITEKIKTAEENAFTEEEYIEIGNKINAQNKSFFEKGFRSVDDLQKDEAIEQEVLRGSAFVDTVPEYKELLSQIASQYGLSGEWVIDTLAHENSHANVAEGLDYKILGYGALFIKDKNGSNNFQPFHLHKAQDEWGPIEFLEKEMKTLEAPKNYDNNMSDADIIEIDQTRKQLRLQREKEIQKRIDEIRKQLGIS